MFTKTVDKTIPTPLYYQLLRIIQQAIDAGDLKPGEAIPTEQELVERYAISRATVRQAIMQLVNDGYLRREKSKGTFVTTPPEKIRFMESLRWFSKEMSRKGIPNLTRILEKDIIPASDDIAMNLQIAPGAPVFYVRRLRLVNNLPLLIDHHCVPYNLCPGIEEKYSDNTSLYETLEHEYGIKLHHGWREFEPIIPSQEDIDLLGIYSTTALLLVKSVVFNETDAAVDYFEARIHGKFTVDIVNTQDFG
jgi:GntR family transcriptional regulator